MQSDWKHFLQQLTPNKLQSSTEQSLHPVDYLSIVRVSGQDAATFLQGQLTCNIQQITPENSRFAAFCNPKGRVISPMLVIKAPDQASDFLLVLPQALVDTVTQRLSMYILRADVKLHANPPEYCLTGVSTTQATLPGLTLPMQAFASSQQTITVIRLPGQPARYLALAAPNKMLDFWQALLSEQFSPATTDLWRFQDLSCGLPWFDTTQSEQFIPQMLNIDKLGGISFDKGCYTGQEIVARTHYLGKNKREMFLAECTKTATLKSGLTVTDEQNPELIGKILTFQCLDTVCRLLLVMPPELSQSNQLTLNNNEKLDLIPFE